MDRRAFLTGAAATVAAAALPALVYADVTADYEAFQLRMLRSMAEACGVPYELIFQPASGLDDGPPA